MDAVYEEKYHIMEEKYWWFQARRRVVVTLLEQLRHKAGRPNWKVLEVGCSGGPLLLKLKELGYPDCAGIDISEGAIEVAKKRGLTGVSVMDAGALQFPDASFDVVIASDILEHLSDDVAGVREWSRVLKPGGYLIVFVPAYPWLWCGHDVVNHHYRRYTQTQLRRVINLAGKLELVKQSYWNIALLGPVGAVRLVQRLGKALGKGGKPKDAMAKVPGLANSLLSTWLGIEDALMTHGLRYPCGVSVMAIARKVG